MTMATISNGECGDGGWTLVMKIDGNQVELKMIKWMNKWIMKGWSTLASITFPSLLLYQLVVILQIYPSPFKWEQGKLAKARRGWPNSHWVNFEGTAVAGHPSRVFWYFPQTIFRASSVDSRLLEPRANSIEPKSISPGFPTYVCHIFLPLITRTSRPANSK